MGRKSRLQSGNLLLAKCPGCDTVNPMEATLQRQLSRSGVTYAVLATRCRYRKAQRLLADENRRVQDIATLLREWLMLA